MRSLIIQISDQILFPGLLLLILILPLANLPFTDNLPQFSKQILFYILTAFLVFIWLLRLCLAGQIKLAKSPLNKPLLIFLLSFSVSLFFSENRLLSLQGQLPRLNEPFLLIISSLLLFIFITSTLQTFKQIFCVFGVLIASIFLLSALTILDFLKTQTIFFLPFLSNASLLTFQNPRETLAYLLPLFPFIINLIFFIKWTGNNFWTSLLKTILLSTTAVFIISALALLGITQIEVFLFLVLISTFFPLLILRKKLEFSIPNFMAVSITCLMCLIISSVIFIPNISPFPLKNSQNALLLPLQEGASITGKVLKSDFKHLLFGSGPETFLLNFSRFHSGSLNRTPLWNTRFDQNSNQILHDLTSFGLIPTLAFLAIFFTYLKTAVTYVALAPVHKNNFIITGVISSILTYFLLSLLQPSAGLSLVPIFSLIAASLVYLKTLGVSAIGTLSFSLSSWKITAIKIQEEDSGKDNLSNLPKANLAIFPLLIFFFISPLLILSIFISFKLYWAESLFQQSLNKNQNNSDREIYDKQLRAIRTNPFRDTYHLAFAQTNLAFALSLSKNNQNTDINQIKTFVSQAIDQSKTAAELNPQNSSNFLTQAIIYEKLIGVIPTAEKWAQINFEQAAKLEPQNPQINQNLALFYFHQNKLNEAEKEIQAAINKKIDLASSHFLLAQIYHEKKLEQQAQKEIEIARQLAQTPSEKIEIENLLQKIKSDVIE